MQNCAQFWSRRFVIKKSNQFVLKPKDTETNFRKHYVTLPENGVSSTGLQSLSIKEHRIVILCLVSCVADRRPLCYAIGICGCPTVSTVSAQAHISQ